RNQGFLFGGTAFALEIATRNAARRIIFFLVVDGERQEVDAFARRLGGDDSRENLRLPVSGDDGAVGLAGDFAGLEGKRAPAPVQLNAVNIEHFGFLSSVQGSEKAMSKTARRWRACLTRVQTASGDPAMAFMTSIGWRGRTFRPAYSAAFVEHDLFPKTGNRFS